MLFRSGENLFEGAKSFVDQNNEITIFSAYLKLDTLKKINESCHVNQVIVRWEIEDLYKKVSDIELYNYCLRNNIALYRNTRIHLKAFWNNDKKVFFGSANISKRGLNELGNYNYELNGINNSITVEDQSYLNKIILNSEYVTEKLFNTLKTNVESLDIPSIVFPKIPTPPPTVDYFLINQLPMTSSPELLFSLYEDKNIDNIESNFAAHDLELYSISKNLNKIHFFNSLKEAFNQHLFIKTFKEAVKNSVNNRNPERNASMRFGAVRTWFSENTTTVPTPRSFELNSYVKILYIWICYFDSDYSWNIPGERSEVIYYRKKN
jgi:hypothetical protein